MQCREFQLNLSAWMEGEAASGAPAHLAACAACRALVADLEAIRTSAGDLAAVESDPPRHLWASLRAQLESEGLIREPAHAGGLAGFFTFFPRPALAGAYLSLVLACAVFVGMQTRPRVEVAAVHPHGLPAVIATVEPQHSEVEQRTLRAMHEHNPAVADTFVRSLFQVDNFIRLCEKTVREQPGNDLAREYLYAAYQQKADLLAVIAERGAMGD